jgi:hypothetical protein
MRDLGTRWGCGPALWLLGVLVALILVTLSVSEPVAPVSTPSPPPVVPSLPSPRPMRPTPTVDSWCRMVPASSCSYYENYGKP